ncbi:hypothetical protein SR70_06675 [Klebsiella aerogenes]|uniref:hypothetical protein n=1 Tax=Klebsiella aerogenes TaxID=548 RepID=UPI0005EEE5E2|nr:hypothetical protein [Klebsiella aerogenes]KJP43150.1 hypothetical protein SR70_06675 [Klebsiella aerogenes]
MNSKQMDILQEKLDTLESTKRSIINGSSLKDMIEWLRYILAELDDQSMLGRMEEAYRFNRKIIFVKQLESEMATLAIIKKQHMQE